MADLGDIQNGPFAIPGPEFVIPVRTESGRGGFETRPYNTMSIPGSRLAHGQPPNDD